MTLPLLAQLADILTLAQDEAVRAAQALECVAGHFAAQTTTLHRMHPPDSLELVAALGVPDSVLRVIHRIPVGKGMAGLCAARAQPVTVCNLQADTSGQSRPGARATGVEGAIVVPILDPDTHAVLGTLGVGKKAAHVYAPSEIEILAACARLFAKHLG